MIVLGLTGSIAMGKSTVAAQFAQLGAKVISADALVHRILAAGGIGVEAVEERFPGVRHAMGHIDRKALGKIVFQDEGALNDLEQLLHPLVVEEREYELHAYARMGVHLAVLEIPLLFETGAEERCDAVACVTAPAFLQRQRTSARGMSDTRLNAILARQWPDREKRTAADFVISTGLGEAYSFAQVKQVVNALTPSNT